MKGMRTRLAVAALALAVARPAEAWNPLDPYPASEEVSAADLARLRGFLPDPPEQPASLQFQHVVADGHQQRRLHFL